MLSFFPPPTITSLPFASSSSTSTATHGTLPPFRSLLVQGPYHPTAPIHLAYSALTFDNHANRHENPGSDAIFDNNSHSEPTTRPVVLLTPSKKHFAESVKAFGDDWISTQTGSVDLIRKLQHITVMYPPTAAHLCFILSMFQVCPPVVPSTDAGKAWLKPKTTFMELPSLIVLHELSRYFVRMDEAEEEEDDDTGMTLRPQWTLSSYLAVVATAQATLSRLLDEDPTKSIRLVIFDSKLPDLKLPILKISSSHQNQTTSAGDTAGPSASSSSKRGEPVAPLVRKYIECVCEFWVEPESFDVEDHPRGNFTEPSMDIDAEGDHDQVTQQRRKRKRGCTFNYTTPQKAGQPDMPRWTWIETKTVSATTVDGGDGESTGVKFTWVD